MDMLSRPSPLPPPPVAFDFDREALGTLGRPDFTRFTQVETSRLRDDPKQYQGQRVSIRGVINNMADEGAESMLWVEDDDGPAMLAVPESAQNHVWNRLMNAELTVGDELRFYGQFLALNEIDGELVPLIEVAYWER